MHVADSRGVCVNQRMDIMTLFVLSQLWTSRVLLGLRRGMLVLTPLVLKLVMLVSSVEQTSTPRWRCDHEPAHPLTGRPSHSVGKVSCKEVWSGLVWCRFSFNTCVMEVKVCI